MTKNILILASSFDFNREILMNVEKSLGLPVVNKRDYLLGYPAVDKRDGYSDALSIADYVVVADPVQYHLDPSEQRVVGVPAESFLMGTGIAQAYSLMDFSLTIRSGIRILIFKKVRNPTDEERLTLIKRLHTYYPDLLELFPDPEGLQE